MKTTCCLLALFAGALHAAVVRGLVVDNTRGRPLARTLVRLKSIEGYAAANLSVRTDRLGVFTFPPVATGAYLLTAARPGFAPMQFGQKAWNAPGVPIFLQPDAATFLQLRLRRLGAITGSLWDENEIGFPDQDMAVYRATRPPKLVGRTKTDDRGIYRFGGLEPGSYLVRNLPRQIDEETSLLPHVSSRSGSSRGCRCDLGDPGRAGNGHQRPADLRQALPVVRRSPAAAADADTGVRHGRDVGGADASGRFAFESLAPGAYGCSPLRRSIATSTARIRESRSNVTARSHSALPRFRCYRSC